MRRTACALVTLLAGCGFLDEARQRPPAGPSVGGAGTTTTSSSSGSLEPLPPGGAGGDEATVMTWNLETFPLYETTVPRAVELIEALEPDVVALQEITDPAAFDELAAATGYTGILNDDPDNFLRLGLLARPGRVMLSDATTLFPDDELRFPRPPLLAHVVILGDTAIDFDVVVVHQKAQVDPDSRERRRLGNVALEAWLQARLASSDEQDVMILGDFNDELLDPPEVNVFGPFLDQPAQYTFLSLQEEQAGAYTLLPFQAMIDHVLVTADMLDEIGEGETKVLELDRSVRSYGELSDHRPVRTWMRW